MTKYLKNTIFLVAFMLLFTSLNAQDWMNYNSLLVDTEQKPIVGTQKIKPYNDNFLIEIQKPLNSSSFCFSIWERGLDTIDYFYLDNSIVSVSDFTILDNMVYFCGSRLTTQGDTVGMIGIFDINNTIQNGVLNYQTTYINNTQELTNISASRNFESLNKISILSIGNNGTADTITGRVVALNNFNNPNFDYKVMYPDFVSLSSHEIFDDVGLLDKYFVTISHVQNINVFILRRYLRVAPDDTTHQDYNTYYSNNTTFNLPITKITPQIHMTTFPDNRVSVAVPALRGQSYCTFLATIKMDSLSYPIYQTIPNNDKDNAILEMDYISETDTLLILRKDVFSGNIVHVLTYANSRAIQSYNSISKYIANDYFPRHLSRLEGDRYVMSGTLKNNSSQGFIFTKFNDFFITQCEKYMNTKIAPLQQNYPIQNSGLNEFLPNIGVWTNFSSTPIQKKLIIKCSEQ